MRESREFRDLVEDHVRCVNRNDDPSWPARHIKAWHAPLLKERAIRDAIVAFATICDAYRGAEHEPGDRELGQDGYFHEHALDMVKALRAYLNFEVGRFDCGTLDWLICDLARLAGVELEP